MLAIGFCYSMVPIARRLYPDAKEQQKFLKRHLNFFNAHPYFTTFALGAIARIEEEEVISGNFDHSKTDRFKSALIGPLGAVGDQLVWALIKPASILFGLAGIIMIPDFTMQLVFLFVLLLMYNVPHLYIRVYGLYKGYQLGFSVYKRLSLENFRLIRNFYGILGAMCLGLYAGFTGMRFVNHDIGSVLVFGIGAVGVYLLRRKQIAFFIAILLPLVLGIITGVIVESV